MSKSPPLGSLAVQAPSLHPQLVHVSPATCHNLSLFKDLLREYRRLDDTINMRLNRTNAQFRDRDREGKSKGNVQDETCMYIWQSLVGMFRRCYGFESFVTHTCVQRTGDVGQKLYRIAWK